MRKELKPSDFCTFPMDSVLQKSEYETIAVNIMKILKRTGNVFKPLPWDEYKEERIKDGNFSERENSFFINVICYCMDSAGAKSFSKSWNNIKED